MDEIWKLPKEIILKILSHVEENTRKNYEYKIQELQELNNKYEEYISRRYHTKIIECVNCDKFESLYLAYNCRICAKYFCQKCNKLICAICTTCFSCQKKRNGDIYYNDEPLCTICFSSLV